MENPNQFKTVSTTNRILFICLCLSFVLFFLVLLGILVAVKLLLFPPAHRIIDIPLPKEWEKIEPTNSSARLTFDEANKYCRRLNKTLVTPRDQLQEDALVQWLQEHEDVTGLCRSFFLGYKADPNKRYDSLDGIKTWPSLDLSFDAATPDEDHTCVRITNDLLIANETPCVEVLSECFLCTYVKDGCNVDKYSRFCYGRTKSELNETTALKSLDLCKQQFPTPTKLYGLMIVDLHHIPINRVSILKAYANRCKGLIGYAIAAKYRLDYVSILDGSKMEYASKRMLITEPNYDCLAIDRSYNYKVITESCSKPACSVCVKVATKDE